MFTLSSAQSSPFCVSSRSGRPIRRASFISKRKPVSPMKPLPRCSWRSTRLPSGFFAWRLGQISRRHGTASVTAFVAGELIKLASIVGLLVLFLAVYADVHWGALLIGLILALKANLFAFLVKT